LLEYIDTAMKKLNQNKLIKTNSYLLASSITLLCASTAHAQTASTGAAQAWPVKPIRVLVPYPAGGTSDILTRMVGAKLTEAWGQPVIADSRPGANGNIAVEMLARSAPDGYTMTLMDIGNLSISPSMYKLPFDIIRDLTPITTITFSPYLLTTHPSLPVKTVAELIALAKKNPGKLNSPVGLGGTIHLATVAMERRVGARWAYIPTKGGQAAVMSVMTGDGDFLFMGVLQTWIHVKSGKLKLIAVSSEAREPMFPQVPTVAETPGLEGFNAGSWQGMLGPAKLPADIVNKTYNEVKRIVATPEFSEKLTSQGSRPQTKTPQEMGKWLASEKDHWAKVVKENGLKVD
jgi:tripartite-type tricarboxylate transporter receptor subunit TctC